jgi:hypothetical protein
MPRRVAADMNMSKSNSVVPDMHWYRTSRDSCHARSCTIDWTVRSAAMQLPPHMRNGVQGVSNVIGSRDVCVATDVIDITYRVLVNVDVICCNRLLVNVM